MAAKRKSQHPFRIVEQIPKRSSFSEKMTDLMSQKRTTDEQNRTASSTGNEQETNHDNNKRNLLTKLNEEDLLKLTSLNKENSCQLENLKSNNDFFLNNENIQKMFSKDFQKFFLFQSILLKLSENKNQIHHLKSASDVETGGNPICKKKPRLCSSPENERKNSTSDKNDNTKIELEFKCLPCGISFKAKQTLEVHQKYYCAFHPSNHVSNDYSSKNIDRNSNSSPAKNNEQKKVTERKDSNAPRQQVDQINATLIAVRRQLNLLNENSKNLEITLNNLSKQLQNIFSSST
ncbi:hypothetical protein SNEBB_004822 [Seison nebaliae]|nr:hypothetical protein SNEBB_004822 [Seison nebaliae]